MSSIPLALYVHFPWCLRKCPYCDFNSYSLAQDQEQLFYEYVETLLIDLESGIRDLTHDKLESIYFGGGTPSLLSPILLEKIITECGKRFTFASNIEITLEANPGTINLELCEGFKDAGINRISLGIQSFNNEKLTALGRVHDTKQAHEAIDAVKQAGFSNFNLDLMFGLPDQGINDAINDLETALSYAPPHFSWYQLTLEPNTKFATQPPVLPHNEELWDIQQAGQDLLRKAGLLQYEVSAYSKPGCECRHNVNYWQYGDYLGIGAGAHSKTTSADGGVRRCWKRANPKKYLEAQESLVEGEKRVILKQLPFEFMLNALRLYRSITYALFQERTGVTIEAISDKLEYARDLGLIELQSDAIVVTDKGKNFLNDLLEIFL